MSTLRRRWRFTGTVQGVGFRYYARAAALHLGLTGWVANNWDGSVTLEAQGDRAALDALNGWDPTGGCLYYYNAKTAADDWIFSRTVQTVIGNHSFAI